MTAAGHRWFAIATAGLVVSPFRKTHLVLSGIAVLLAWPGALAPDRLEVIGGVHWIAHRTLTHWLMGWVLAVGFLFLATRRDALMLPALGYCAGAFSHALADIPNPAGVPVLHPLRKVSLRLWHSGQFEFEMIAVMAMVATLAWMI